MGHTQTDSNNPLIITKPGGFDSQDQLLKPVEIILTAETRLFFVSVKIFKIETFESRLGHVEILVETVKIVETNQDC